MGLLLTARNRRLPPIRRSFSSQARLVCGWILDGRHGALPKGLAESSSTRLRDACSRNAGGLSWSFRGEAGCCGARIEASLSE